MFGAWLGVSEVLWETAPDTLCRKPRPFLFLSPLHSPVLLSPFLSTASASEEPTAKRLLNTVRPALALPEGGGEAAAWGSPQAPNSVTSLHMLQTNKTLTRVTSRAPQAEGAVSPPICTRCGQSSVSVLGVRVGEAFCRPSREGGPGHHQKVQDFGGKEERSCCRRAKEKTCVPVCFSPHPVLSSRGT